MKPSERLREWSTGHRAVDICAGAKVDKSDWSKWLSGKKKPGAKVVKRLCDFFGKTMGDYYDE